MNIRTTLNLVAKQLIPVAVPGILTVCRCVAGVVSGQYSVRQVPADLSYGGVTFFVWALMMALSGEPVSGDTRLIRRSNRWKKEKIPIRERAKLADDQKLTMFLFFVINIAFYVVLTVLRVSQWVDSLCVLWRVLLWVGLTMVVFFFAVIMPLLLRIPEYVRNEGDSS